MNEENTPQEQDDLLNWMPPELVERARITAEKDAKLYAPKKRRTNFSTPPKGDKPRFSLAALLCGALLQVLLIALMAVGANAQEAVQRNGRLWLALWLVSQACILCVYLLYLLPLGRETRRPVLATMLAASLASSAAFGIAQLPSQKGDYPMWAVVASAAFMVLLEMALKPNLWLLIGLLRRKPTEKFSALMGWAAFALVTFGLITALAGKNTGPVSPPHYVTVLTMLSHLCHLGLIHTWPVLDRAVLSKQTEGASTDGQSE